MDTTKVCPKSAALFVTQIIVILVVVISSIINLSRATTTNKEMWIALLASTIGIILPNPRLRNLNENTENPINIATEEPLTSLQS